MFHSFVYAALVGFVLSLATPHAIAQEIKVEVTQAEEEPKEVKIVKTWRGSVGDEKLMQPECIVSQKGLEAVWKAWKAEGVAPKVDFTKHLIVAAYGGGSAVTITRVDLDVKGNLKFIGIATADFGQGFRYVHSVVGREGVKTVNGKELPKE